MTPRPSLYHRLFPYFGDMTPDYAQGRDALKKDEGWAVGLRISDLGVIGGKASKVQPPLVGMPVPAIDE